MKNGLLLKKQQNYYPLRLKHFVYGIMKVKSVLLERHPTNADIISRTYNTLLMAVIILLKKKKSVIVEYLPKNKWTTLNDKKIFLDLDTLNTSWLQTSVLGLIGKEKDLKPFWTNQCEEISQKLWLPIETDCVGSLSNFWNGYSQPIKSDSWFLMKTRNNHPIKNSQMTSSPSYMFIPVEKWGEEGIRTRKIQIYPNQKQKKIITQWMGCRRFIYNKTLEKVKKEEDKLNFYELRNKYVTSKNNDNVKEWEKETPKDIRAGAIRDMIKNFNTSFSLLKNKQINGFNMKYASKKDSPSIEIPKTAIKLKDGGLFMYNRYIPDKIKIGKRQSKLKLSIDYDCRLQCKNNKWFLNIPIKTKIEDIEDRKEICSLDPGVRNFQTLYSEDMVVQIKINKEMVSKLQKKIDLFKSLRATKIIKNKRLKRKQRKIYFRINNLIDDLHHKTINFLTKTFNYIILPTFESQELSGKIKNRGVNRDLLQLKHFMFKERLKSKCLIRSCYLDICTEEYTSKTCGRCGVLNNIGSKDVFSCEKCKLVIDRDINGARNIAIKRLNEIINKKKY